MSEKKEFSCNAYMGREPYVFASYAHTDTNRVERILRYLFHQGFRIWYDQRGEGIPVSREWHDVIMERLEHSSCFVSFISNGIELRKYVMEEILKAIEKSEKDPGYKIIFIFLEKVSPGVFPAKIQAVMRQRQFIEQRKYGGVTERFIRRLSGAGWPEEIVDNRLRAENGMSSWNPEQLGDAEIRENVEDLFAESRYIYPQAEYTVQKVTTEGREWEFYRISPEQMDTRTVYPISMDNQWVPPGLLTEECFLKGGLQDETVRARIQKEQREDIFRGLLHNWQILVNRASLLNSPIFSDWYTAPEEDEDRRAFERLVQCGAIAAFLMGEQEPGEKPRFDIDEGVYEKWREFCFRNPVFCLRMDWENEQSNQFEMDRLLGYSFQNFCLEAASDRYFLRDMVEAFQIPPEDEEDFCNAWREVQTDVMFWKEEQKKENAGKTLQWRTYPRNRFYESFLVNRHQHRVNEGILDLKKNKFVLEMKQIIDFKYSTGLPNALHIQTLIPKESRLGQNAPTGELSVSSRREISEDEVIFSIVEFQPDFLTEEIWYAENPTLALADVDALRGLKEWRSYMNAVTGGQRRAKLDELYLDDIQAVWERYQAWMCSAMAEFPHLTWKKAEGSVSVIYRIGEKEIVAVYRFGDKKPLLWQNEPARPAEALRRKSSMTVDYVCGNILKEEQRSPLLTEIRLFEGITHWSGEQMYRAVVDKYL